MTHEPYHEIYKMKVAYEDLKRGGKGWYKLKWKPIWFGTYYLWISKPYKTYRLGFEFHTAYSAHNGWGRSYDRIDITISLIFYSLSFWIKYNYIVMASGPSDVKEPKPIDVGLIKNRL